MSNELNAWLQRQGISKLESPVYFPQAKGIAERAVQTVKSTLSTWKKKKCHTHFNSFWQRVLFHHSISSYSRGKSPAEAVFGRQLRVPIVTRFQQGEPVWSQGGKLATYIMSKGSNTSYVLDDKKLQLVSNNQLAMATVAPEKVMLSESSEIQGNLEKPVETEYADSSSKQSVQLATSSANESLADNAYGPMVAASSENESRGRPRRNVRPPSRWTYDKDFVGTDNV